MKRTILRILIILLLGLTFVTIFNFSNQDGETSGSLSRKVTTKFVNTFPYTKNLSKITKNKIIEKSQPIVRKMAHFTIYAVVGILIMSFISTYKVRLLYKLLISIGVGLVYAISDEIHQSFVPNRGPSIIDVGIDTAGVIFGILIVLITISVFKALADKN